MGKSKLVIIGGGPAGLTAAIYAARAKLDTFVYEGFSSGVAGGQLMTTTEVENFPGFPEGIDGPQLVLHMRKQAERFGTKVLTEDIEQIDLSSFPFKLKTASYEVIADAIILATGATARLLYVEGMTTFWQKGISACAVCDGAAPIFRDKDLYVIGGGDSACEEGIFLTKYAKKVYVVHRRDQFRASKIMADRVMNHPKIEVIWDHELVKAEGDNILKAVVLKNVKTQVEQKREAAGLFFAIGFDPNTGFLKGQIALDENRYIKEVEPGTSKTNIEGVFAAGDVKDHRYRQAVTAAGSGCMAALDAERWLSAKGLIG